MQKMPRCTAKFIQQPVARTKILNRCLKKIPNPRRIGNTGSRHRCARTIRIPRVVSHDLNGRRTLSNFRHQRKKFMQPRATFFVTQKHTGTPILAGLFKIRAARLADKNHRTFFQS